MVIVLADKEFLGFVYEQQAFVIHIQEVLYLNSRFALSGTLRQKTTNPFPILQ